MSGAVERRLIGLLVIGVSVLLLGVAWTRQEALHPASDRPLDLARYRIRLVYENDFSRPQKIDREEDFIQQLPEGGWRRKGKPAPDAEWVAEGWGGCAVRDGTLRVAPSPFDTRGQPKPVEPGLRSHMVVWNRRIFPGDFLLELDMNPCGSTNGLTIVLFCAAGKNGEDLFELSLPPRRADYVAYHSGAIANYTDSYWSRNTESESLSNRLRRNPGFALVAEGPSLTTGPTQVTHHLRILKAGAHIEVEVNGKVLFGWDDPAKPLADGRIGLRSMEGVTMVAYDNFKVWQVVAKSAASRKLINPSSGKLTKNNSSHQWHGSAGGHNQNRAARVKQSRARKQADVWQLCWGSIH
jgi:hypothetical protein